MINEVELINIDCNETSHGDDEKILGKFVDFRVKPIMTFIPLQCCVYYWVKNESAIIRKKQRGH